MEIFLYLPFNARKYGLSYFNEVRLVMENEVHALKITGLRFETHLPKQNAEHSRLRTGKMHATMTLLMRSPIMVLK